MRLMENRGARTVVEIASTLGVRTNQLHQWRLKLAGTAGASLSAVVVDDREKENERLRRRVRELEVEREILKKAAAFFAKEGM